MSYPFPSIAPTSRPLTAGSWPSIAIRSADGGESTVTTQDKELGRELPLEFLIRNDELSQIVNHFKDHGVQDNFIFTTTTIPAFYTPSGYTWRWREQPAIGDLHNNVRQIVCRFVCVPLPSTSVNALPTSITWTFSGGLLDSETGFNEQALPATVTVGATEQEAMSAEYTFASNGVVQTGSMQSTRTFLTDGIIYPSSEVITSLLLHFDGTPGTSAVVDSSTYNHTITRMGNTSELAAGVISNISAFGQGYNFRGTPASPDTNVSFGPYLSVPGSNLFLFDGPFLISVRFRHWFHQSLSKIFHIGASSWTGAGVPQPGEISLTSDATELEVVCGDILTPRITTGPVALDTWHHVFITRWPSGMIYMSLNGNVVGTPVSNPKPIGCDISSAQPRQRVFYIRADTDAVAGGPSRRAHIVMDEFLVVKGGFTTDFSVPTSPYPNP